MKILGMYIFTIVTRHETYSNLFCIFLPASQDTRLTAICSVYFYQRLKTRDLQQSVLVSMSQG